MHYPTIPPLVNDDHNHSWSHKWWSIMYQPSANHFSLFIIPTIRQPFTNQFTNQFTNDSPTIQLTNFPTIISNQLTNYHSCSKVGSWFTSQLPTTSPPQTNSPTTWPAVIHRSARGRLLRSELLTLLPWEMEARWRAALDGRPVTVWCSPDNGENHMFFFGRPWETLAISVVFPRKLMVSWPKGFFGDMAWSVVQQDIFAALVSRGDSVFPWSSQVLDDGEWVMANYRWS